MLKGNLEKVVQHGQRADSIVKNMLQHSREGSGEQRPADINALLDDSLNLAYHGAHAEKPGFSITLQRDNWHRLWMDRFDDRVRCRRQESVDEVRAGDRLGLRAAVALELRPDAGERGLSFGLYATPQPQRAEVRTGRLRSIASARRRCSCKWEAYAAPSSGSHACVAR